MRPSPHDSSRLRHLLDAGYWLQGSKQHASGDSIGQTGNIQAVVIAIDEVHVGVAGRTEQHRIPRRPSGCGVRGRVAFAEIRFGFDNSSGENSARRFADEQFP
jgi:hypothetical protein